MFSSNECVQYILSWIQCTIYKCLVQMSVQYTGEYMFNSNECTIFCNDIICLVQMSVQYTWQYMFSSNECTIYLRIYIFSNECTIFLTVYA